MSHLFEEIINLIRYIIVCLTVSLSHSLIASLSVVIALPHSRTVVLSYLGSASHGVVDLHSPASEDLAVQCLLRVARVYKKEEE